MAPLKFVMHIKRKQGMSEETFHEYWSKTHPTVVNAWLAKHGVIKYTQYHTPSSTRALGETVWTTLGKDHILDFDGTVELIVPDVEALQKALDDPMYRETVQPDEEAFIDGEKSYRSVGYEQTYIVDGKVL